MEKYAKNIINIINSDSFQEKLQKDFYNFPNQKLEFHLRNSLVDIFNTEYAEKEERSFAEHPRYSFKVNDKNKRITVDFSICKKNKVDFTMEIKYNFTNDNTQLKNYKYVVERDFINRIWNKEDEKIHAFLLVICETDKEKLRFFENEWGTNDISRFHTKLTSENWKNNISTVFNCLKDQYNLNLLQAANTIETSDLSANFHYYLIYRK